MASLSQLSFPKRGFRRPACLILGFGLAAPVVGAQEAPDSDTAKTLKVARSENAGRMGQYTVSTPIKGCNFHVYVPRGYSADRPAGIHLFLDGQGSCAKNDNFGRWARHSLEPHHLIGINMQYLDGNNAKDIPGKLAAARFAVAQVQLDYKVIPGRGVISSFSGGGVIHGRFWKAHAKQKAPDRSWPFLHHALYSSNWSVGLEGAVPMSWFLAAGDRTKDNVWTTMMGVTHHLQKLGRRDVVLGITKGKGHAATGQDAAESARVFARTDVIFAPFLYEPDWKDVRLHPIAKNANARRFQAALSGLDRLDEDADLPEETRRRAGELRRSVESRLNDVVALAEEFLETDAVLADCHLPVILDQLKGCPEHLKLKARFEQTAQTAAYQKTVKLQKEFASRFPELMNRFNGKLVPKQIPFLEECVGTSGRPFVARADSRKFP